MADVPQAPEPMEDARWLSEERYRLAAQAGRTGVWDWGLETGAVYVDPSLKSLLGFEDDDVPSDADALGNLLHPDDRDRLRASAETCLEGEADEFKIEHRVLHKDGSVRWFLTQGAVQRDARGKAVRFLGTATDVSERKRAEDALLAAKERLQYMVSSGPAVIYACDPSGDYRATFITENVAEQLGYEARQFVEDPRFWADRIHPEDAPRVFAGLPPLFQTGRHIHEYRFRHKDGTYRWMRDELRLVRDAAGDPLEIIGSWLNISAQAGGGGAEE